MDFYIVIKNSNEIEACSKWKWVNVNVLKNSMSNKNNSIQQRIYEVCLIYNVWFHWRKMCIIKKIMFSMINNGFIVPNKLLESYKTYHYLLQL